MYSLKTTNIFSFVIRKHVSICISFLVFSGLTIYYVDLQNVTLLQPFIKHADIVDLNIECHYLDDNDALPSAEDRDFIPKPNSIFFHETSCSGGLNSRRACNIESAARANPRRDVYVMFSSPVDEVEYQRSCIAKLRRFHNVRFARVHISDYAKNTPLEAMVANRTFNTGRWPMETTSDVLRYLTLYKWGGVYLDTDMLVVKSLTPLGHNWVAKEDNISVAGSAMAFSMDHLGRKLAEAAINEMKTTYRTDIWIHNGPGTVRRVLHRMCNTSNQTEWSTTTCQGLEVYERDYFHPVHYSKFNKYFKSGEFTDVEKAYAHHLWNKLSSEMEIENDSPYERMAQKFCPTIYKMYGKEFGS